MYVYVADNGQFARNQNSIHRILVVFLNQVAQLFDVRIVCQFDDLVQVSGKHPTIYKLTLQSGNDFGTIEGSHTESFAASSAGLIIETSEKGNHVQRFACLQRLSSGVGKVKPIDFGKWVELSC